MSTDALSRQPPKLVLGCANFGSPSDPFCKHTSPEAVATLLTTFTSYGHDTIDTSRRYASGESEKILGQALQHLKTTHPTAPDIAIDTKTLSAPGCHKPENLRQSIADSLAALQASSVNTIYLHFPDRTVPLSDPISMLSDAVQSGKAKQWGVSNYTLEDMHEILKSCAENDWIRPAIYQGEYNALSRGNEDIIRLCHEKGIAFYAYSPGAGGVFSPSGSRISAKTLAGERVRSLYGSESMQSAVQKVRDVAEREGLGGHEVAIRWAFCDGMLDGKYGDAVVIGVGSDSQLRDTCEFLRKGGLEGELKGVVDGVWQSVKT